MKKREYRIKESASPLVREIFDFVTSQEEIDMAFSSLPFLGKLAQTFLAEKFPLNEENWQEFRDQVNSEIQKQAFYQVENYEVSPDFNAMNTLQNFLGELSTEINSRFDQDWKKGDHRLMRMVSPPLPAYDYKGFCPELKDTGKSFGLLSDYY